MTKEINNTRNPILPPEIHIPDSEAHVMPDGKLYIYGSYDTKIGVYCSEEYHVVSTPDMKHWTVHDKSITGAEVPWIFDNSYPHYPGIDWSNPTPFIKKMIADAENAAKEKENETAKDTQKDEKKAVPEPQSSTPPRLLYAPDCIYKNGKYYLYFCSIDDQEGVAVSDRPEGPFTNPVQLPCGGIDPAIFVDDDGKGYYYWGQLRSHGVKLNDDMVSFDTANVCDNLVTEEEHFFHEGSSMRKIGGRYYYVYADMERGRPTSLGYSVSDSPLGPFTYKGILIDNRDCDPESWNNHGSIECVNGEWYVFYHRSTRKSQFCRRLCVEKLHLNPDGTFEEAKMTTQGVGAPIAKDERIEGFRACGVFGGAYIDLVKPDDPSKEWLTAPNDGCGCIFRYVSSPDGFDCAEIEASGSADVEILLDDETVGNRAVCGNGVIELKNIGAGEKTLKIKLRNPENFHLDAVTLH